MKRLSQFIYLVATGEEIDLQITAHNIPPMVNVALDGQPLIPIDQKKISFVITKNYDKEHHLDLSFFFSPDSPADASYKVLVTSSFGHESDSFVVKRENPHRDLVLVFRVGDTGPK